MSFCYIFLLIWFIYVICCLLSLLCLHVKHHLLEGKCGEVVESNPRGPRFKPPYGGAAFETFQKCGRSSIFVKNKFDGYHRNFFRHLCELVLRHQIRVSNYFVNSFYSVGGCSHPHPPLPSVHNLPALPAGSCMEVKNKCVERSSFLPVVLFFWVMTTE